MRGFARSRRTVLRVIAVPVLELGARHVQLAVRVLRTERRVRIVGHHLRADNGSVRLADGGGQHGDGGQHEEAGGRHGGFFCSYASQTKTI